MRYTNSDTIDWLTKKSFYIRIPKENYNERWYNITKSEPGSASFLTAPKIRHLIRWDMDEVVLCSLHREFIQSVLEDHSSDRPSLPVEKGDEAKPAVAPELKPEPAAEAAAAAEPGKAGASVQPPPTGADNSDGPAEDEAYIHEIDSAMLASIRPDEVDDELVLDDFFFEFSLGEADKMLYTILRDVVRDMHRTISGTMFERIRSDLIEKNYGKTDLIVGSDVWEDGNHDWTGKKLENYSLQLLTLLENIKDSDPDVDTADKGKRKRKRPHGHSNSLITLAENLFLYAVYSENETERTDCKFLLSLYRRCVRMSRNDLTRETLSETLSDIFSDGYYAYWNLGTKHGTHVNNMHVTRASFEDTALK